MSMKEDYNEKIRLELKTEMGVNSVFAVPSMEKIVINMGIGKVRENKVYVKESESDITAISGQKSVARKAKVSISNFKLRQGQMAGYSVTLRDNKMWDFYEKLVTIVFPRVKDFQGVSKKSFDGSGNYNLGLKEHLVFPEIDANKISYSKPLQVTINTSAKDDESGYILLKALGMPFKD